MNVDLQTDATLQVDISDALSERDKVKFTVHTKVRKIFLFRGVEINHEAEIMKKGVMSCGSILVLVSVNQRFVRQN